MAPKLSLLALLGVATVALPLSGFVTPGTGQNLPARAITVASQASWGDVEQNTSDASGDPLEAEASAVVRARLQQAVGTCAVDGGASGVRQAAALDKSQIVYFPLAEGTFTVSSPFGYRLHPIFGTVLLHEGADYSAPQGTEVHAAASGVVDTVSRDSGAGNYVRLKHTINGQTVYTVYKHLVNGGTVVQAGQSVEAGDVISHVGSTGNSTGPHLHFEVRPTLDSPIDPVGWLKEHHSVYLGKECS